MPTRKKRFAITLSEDMEQSLYDLRKTDEYCRCSLSEIIRSLLTSELTNNQPNATDQPDQTA